MKLEHPLWWYEKNVIWYTLQHLYRKQVTFTNRFWYSYLGYILLLTPSRGSYSNQLPIREHAQVLLFAVWDRWLEAFVLLVCQNTIFVCFLAQTMGSKFSKWMTHVNNPLEIYLHTWADSLLVNKRNLSSAYSTKQWFLNFIACVIITQKAQ